MNIMEDQSSEGIQEVKRIMHLEILNRQTRSDMGGEHVSVSEESEWYQTITDHQQQMKKQAEAYRRQIQKIQSQISNNEAESKKLFLQEKIKTTPFDQATQKLIQSKSREIHLSSMLTALKQKEANAETQIAIGLLQKDLEVLREKIKLESQERVYYRTCSEQLYSQIRKLSGQTRRLIKELQILQFQVEKIEKYLFIRSLVRRQQFIPDF